MAKHNGCPECQNLYGAHARDISTEQDGNGEQRSGSSTQNGQTSPSTVFNPYYTGRPRTPANGNKHTPIDRQEIIRRIKTASRPTSPELERPSSRSSLKRFGVPVPPQEETVVQASEANVGSSDVQQNNQDLGQQIERPRSALHRGDFREKEGDSSAFQRFGETRREEPAPSLSTSPVAPWHPHFPSAGHRRSAYIPQPRYDHPSIRPGRSRAVSTVSLASSFVKQPPTSPLVQASRPDTPEPASRQLSRSRSPDKSRRRTFSPQYLQRGSTLDYPASARNYGYTQPTPLRAERTFPYQAHQPRRSLNSFASVPHTPVSRTRRPSLSDSPLHHATMVGSYEESILRGRMSTTPSKPLNFVAQIGVLGKGDCKSSLRCPPHATVPFPAVFYSYGSSTRSTTTSDQPSPYVGLVDLENNLPSAHPSPEKRRQRLQAALSAESSRAPSLTREETSTSDAQARRRRRKQKQKRRSGSPKAPPGGSYRIPQQGQLQIVIKNPNKTAVKLFLIPYDLSDMEAGTKTFIRQRSYSAGPIIDMPLSSRTNLGTNRPEAALNASDDPNDRPTLRYLVHLHICCPSKGRYFLYKSIRIVFANRVPDGKERLRNEIQLPEPKYSTYKPGRDSNAGIAPAATTVTANKNPTRRRSALEPTMSPPPAPDPEVWTKQFLAHSLPWQAEYAPQLDGPVERRSPFYLNALPTLESRPASRQPETPTAEVDEATSMRSKRLADPFIFDRDRSRERPGLGGRNESLLSMRLKDLAFQAQLRGDEDAMRD